MGINFYKRSAIPQDLTPSQLQVLLQDEKQENFIIFVVAIILGAVASSVWPSFASVFSTYAGFLLAGLSLVFGVNVAHKALNNKTTGVTSEEVETEVPTAPQAAAGAAPVSPSAK